VPDRQTDNHTSIETKKHVTVQEGSASLTDKRIDRLTYKLGGSGKRRNRTPVTGLRPLFNSPHFDLSADSRKSQRLYNHLQV